MDDDWPDALTDAELEAMRARLGMDDARRLIAYVGLVRELLAIFANRDNWQEITCGPEEIEHLTWIGNQDEPWSDAQAALGISPDTSDMID